MKLRSQIALDGFAVTECLRWRDGALWFSDLAVGTVHRWTPGATSAETVVGVPGRAGGLGWLPDGRLLTVSMDERRVYRREDDGSLVVHAELGEIAGGVANDMLVDESGRAYVGNFGFDYHGFIHEHPNSAMYAPPGPPRTPVAAFAADGTLIGTTDPLYFPNGMALTRRGTLVVAETLAMRLTEYDISDSGLPVNPRPFAPLIEAFLWKAVNASGLLGTVARTISAALDHPQIAARSSSPIAPDGIAMHPDGETVWVANALRNEAVRVARGGKILDRVRTSQQTLDCVVGDDGVLYLATVPTDDPAPALAERGGRIETVDLGRSGGTAAPLLASPTKAGKVVMITGAASGIGAATATQALERGNRVAVTDIDLEAARTVAAKLRERAIAVQLDIRDADHWQRALDEVEQRLGPVDVLVNNAGIAHTGNAVDLTPDQHRDIIEVNLIGTINGTLAALERMKQQGHGHIINICSMTSFLPLQGYSSYGATKHGMRAFHHAVAIEERRSPVGFTIVHPPSTRTPMLDQELADETAVIAFAEKSVSAEEVAAKIVDAIDSKPVEVVFPPLAGRFQRAVGAQAALVRRVMPLVELSARRNRKKILEGK